MVDDSDLTVSVAIPDEIRQWNWGAFLLAPFWGIGNRVFLGLLGLIPLVGLVISIILGIKGNEWAWRNRRWESPKVFLDSQRKWSYWGWGILIALSLLYIVLEQNIAGLWILLGALLIVGFFDTIFGRAGYRYAGGMSLLMFVPIANMVMLLIFVISEWPIERQVRDLKIRCGSANEEDAYSLIREAIRLEVKGQFDEALLKYQEVVTRFRDTAAGNDAEKSIEAVKAKISGW
jgi:uncharacterized membrane protein